MAINEAGMALIEGFETLQLDAYLPTGHDVPTLGFGHTSGVQMGDTCTEEQALEWLAEDLQQAESDVQELCPDYQNLTQNQYAALVSLVFNVGRSAKGIHDQSSIILAVNRGDYAAAAADFAAWCHQAGQVLRGLVRRRAAEAALFATPD